MRAQSLPVRGVKDDYKEDFFYREDWLGEPWRKPEPVVLIHGNDESSVEWYAWVPRMAQEYRLIRPDLPGLGHSNIPRGFEYSLANLAKFVTQVMDKAGVDSAHIVGAKTGGAVAMRFAADYPKRTRSLVVVGGPAASFAIANPSPIPQRDRLGSNASQEMIAYWNTLFSRPNQGTKGLNQAMSNFDLAKEGVLQRIGAPTLVITADRTKMHSSKKRGPARCRFRIRDSSSSAATPTTLPRRMRTSASPTLWRFSKSRRFKKNGSARHAFPDHRDSVCDRRTCSGTMGESAATGNAPYAGRQARPHCASAEDARW
jgi:pimeloyl-ACP methyl ester carboxylesterase